MIPKLTFRKSADIPGRYFVELDGVKAGWVSKSSLDGTWSFHAPVHTSIRGERLDSGAPTRRDAVANGLSDLKIYHGSRVARLDWDTVKDEFVWLPIEEWQEAQYRAVTAELNTRLGKSI